MLLPFVLFGALSIASAGIVADWSVINPKDFKFFPVAEMLKVLKAQKDVGQSFVIFCQFVYCHGQGYEECNKSCNAMKHA